MGWLDIVLGLSLALSTLEGFKRGLFQEIAGCIGLFAGFFMAVCLDKPLANMLTHVVGIHAPWAGILGFVIPFVCTIALIQAAAGFMSHVFKHLSLGWLNRTAGGAFALLKSIVVLSILLNIYELFDQDRSLVGADRIAHSRLYVPILNAAPALFPSFPDVSLRSEPDEPAEPKLIV